MQEVTLYGYKGAATVPWLPSWKFSPLRVVMKRGNYLQRYKNQSSLYLAVHIIFNAIKLEFLTFLALEVWRLILFWGQPQVTPRGAALFDTFFIIFQIGRCVSLHHIGMYQGFSILSSSRSLFKL